MMTKTEPVMVLGVTVTEHDGAARYSYELWAAGGTVRGALQQVYGVEVNQSLVRDLCQKIDQAAKKALREGTDRRADLTEYGQTLYHHLFRPVRGNAEPELVAGIRRSRSPLLVRTNETLVPWEVLHDGTEFVGLSHDLGQGSVVRDDFVAGRDVGRIERALIVGDPLGDLRAARQEAERIAEWLETRGTECTLLLGEQAALVDVVNKLSTTRFDLLHYCGHVAIMSRAAESGLMLHRRRLLNESALRTASRMGAPPIVFINGCQSAGPIANLCVSFMTMGAKLVVGTRTEVAEASARRFAEEFYRRLLGGRTAGSAIREARLSLLEEEDGAWASFLLYGDPGLRISGASALPVPSPAEVTPPGIGDNGTPVPAGAGGATTGPGEDPAGLPAPPCDPAADPAPENRTAATKTEPSGGEGRRWPALPRAVVTAALTTAVVATVAMALTAVIINAPWHRDVPRPTPSTPAQGTVTPVLSDPHKVDPCTLQDQAGLARFGDTELDTAYGGFGRCDVLVHPRGGGEVDVKAELLGPDPTLGPTGPIQRVDGIEVWPGPEDSASCERTLLLRDKNLVDIVAELNDKGPANLCVIADTVVRSAAGKLSAGSLPPRRTEPVRASLFWSDACSLLDSRTLSLFPGVDARHPHIGLGNWECRWESTTSRQTLLVRFDQNPPPSAQDGRHLNVAGHVAFVKSNDYSPDSCRVEVVHRTFRTSDGNDKAELLLVVIMGRGDAKQRCRVATAIASHAAAQLPRA